MADELAKLSPVELGSFYRRLADVVEKNLGGLQVSLSAMLLRKWVDNRDRDFVFEFAAPEHIKNHSKVLEALSYHRAVYLSEKKARLGSQENASEKWRGLVPRLQAKTGAMWDGKSPVSMEYEALVEVPIAYQFAGSNADKDLLYALHGFQLHSTVSLIGEAVSSSKHIKVLFQAFAARIADRYDWDYSEHLTVPNPDFGSKEKNAVAPSSQTVVVHHSNAKRLEDAGLACPYNLMSYDWSITDARYVSAGIVNPEKSLSSWW